MIKKNKIYMLILLSIFTSGIFAQTNSLDSLIDQVLKVSPELKMLRSKYSASENRINENSNLPDPTLTLGFANLPINSFSFTQEPMTGKIIGLSQAIPFPGKLGSLAEVSEKDAEIIKQEINDARNEIVKNVSQNYYELIYARKALLIERESKNLLQKISEVVNANYTVLKASQQNILKVQLEITGINDKIEELKSKENSTAAILNSYLLRNQDSQVYTDSLPEIKYHTLTQTQLDSLAIQNRSFLIGIELAKEKAQLQEKLSKYDFYPNFNLSVQYSQRDKIAKTNTPLDDFFSFMVGISLPLNYGGKVTSKIDESAAIQNMYEEQYQMSIQMLNGNFGSSISKLNSLKERIKLINEALLPQAQHTYSSSLSSYQVGEVDFINVIDAQNKLFQIETNLYRLKTDYLKEIEELKFLTGSKEL